MELMFIIAAKQLNMFRGGNGLPAAIGWRFMGAR